MGGDSNIWKFLLGKVSVTHIWGTQEEKQIWGIDNYFRTSIFLRLILWCQWNTLAIAVELELRRESRAQGKTRVATVREKKTEWVIRSQRQKLRLCFVIF